MKIHDLYFEVNDDDYAAFDQFCDTFAIPFTSTKTADGKFIVSPDRQNDCASCIAWFMGYTNQVTTQEPDGENEIPKYTGPNLA